VSQRVRLHLEECAECRSAFEEMKALQRLTSEIQFTDPPEETMEALEKSLSVQAPRRFGWGLVIAGLLSWVIYLLVQVIRYPRWPSVPAILTGGVIAGFVLVFLSVLRQRWIERPHDRYRRVRR